MNKSPLLYVIISAILFGLSAPLAKLLGRNTPPLTMAGLLYLGSFIGLSIYTVLGRISNSNPVRKSPPLDKKDFPWLAGAVVAGGIIAPFCLMTGLTMVTGFSASLMLNLEGVATAVIAVFLFKENAGKRLWLSLACTTAAGIFLSWDPALGKFSIAGPLWILLAMICWGVDNNLTRNISEKDPVQIAKIKGLVAGASSLLIACGLGIRISLDLTLALVLALGSCCYGISLVFFIKALKGLGASRTGAFFSIAPFIGALASLIILKEWTGWVMFPATALMMVGIWMIGSEKHAHMHTHRPIIHTHAHDHDDAHHQHKHTGALQEPHFHEHVHDETTHWHVHWPDMHHRHEHEKSVEK
jgi:drug/metabolite transporter (DMT)-like permease